MALLPYVRARANSTLVPLDDAAIDRGIARIQAASAAEGGPVGTRLELLVLQ